MRIRRNFDSLVPTLMLAEMREDKVFVRRRAGQCPWPIQTTGEDCSLYLADRLLVLAGRQVVSAEGVEVLAQCTAAQFANGRPLEETIEEIQAAGALAVLPWGVGKWLGRRGKLVTEAAARSPILLGDNAGRPPFWSFPAQSLRRALTDYTPVNALGRRVSLFTFLRQQLGLRIRQ